MFYTKDRTTSVKNNHRLQLQLFIFQDKSSISISFAYLDFGRRTDVWDLIKTFKHISFLCIYLFMKTSPVLLEDEPSLFLMFLKSVRLLTHK